MAEAAQAETRKLAANMFTDMVGFSRQMGTNEAHTLRLLAVHNQIIQQAVAEHHGAVIKTVGDAFLVDFPWASVGTAYALAERYKEARAILQRYLGRYPNILHAHLVLAAVYSELGQKAEARAEGAEVPRINPKFSLEVHKQRLPIKDPAM